jgi:hypothetical protein
LRVRVASATLEFLSLCVFFGVILPFMSNEYGISREDIKEIRERDINCVYCHKVMINHSGNGRHGDWSTIEHFDSLPPWDNPAGVAVCCLSCNSSKRDKNLLDWFKTPYCIERNINEETVAEPVKKYLLNL